MTSVSPQFSLVLNEDERTQLLSLLEILLRQTRVEVHRTEAPDYREWVQHREEVLENIINRLRILSPVSGTSERESK